MVRTPGPLLSIENVFNSPNLVGREVIVSTRTNFNELTSPDDIYLSGKIVQIDPNGVVIKVDYSESQQVYAQTLIFYLGDQEEQHKRLKNLNFWLSNDQQFFHVMLAQL